jgi:hypothetical protein
MTHSVSLIPLKRRGLAVVAFELELLLSKVWLDGALLLLPKVWLDKEALLLLPKIWLDSEVLLLLPKVWLDKEVLLLLPKVWLDREVVGNDALSGLLVGVLGVNIAAD